MPSFDPTSTALVLIDLQKGIAQSGYTPLADAVVATAKDLAARFREAGAPVVLVHVGWREDGKDRPSAAVDRPMLPEKVPEDFSALIDGLEQPGDVVVLKHHWGAFTGSRSTWSCGGAGCGPWWWRGSRPTLGSNRRCGRRGS